MQPANSNHSSIKSFSTIPKMKTMKDAYSSCKSVKSTMKSKSSVKDIKDISIISQKKMDLCLNEPKSFEKSGEDLNMTKRSEQVGRTNTPDSNLSMSNRKHARTLKIVKKKPFNKMNEKTMSTVVISTSSNNMSNNNISQVSKDKTIVRPKLEMSPHLRISNSTSQLFTENDKKNLRVPFNIPDEPSDSFELRISKKQLMDTFHHDK